MVHLKYLLCKYALFFQMCVLVVVVGPGAPPDGHVSGARFLFAGRPAAHEEESGKEIDQSLTPPVDKSSSH